LHVAAPGTFHRADYYFEHPEKVVTSLAPDRAFFLFALDAFFRRFGHAHISFKSPLIAFKNV
jgi:hypothetical protein